MSFGAAVTGDLGNFQAYHALLAALDAPRVQARAHEHVHIGVGAYGYVYEGELLDKSGTSLARVAMKVLREDRPGVTFEAIERRLRREVAIWKHIGSHDNILPLLGLCTAPDRPVIWLVTPFMSGRDLRMYLRDHQVGKIQRHSLIRDIAKGLEYLHGKSIVHGDVKPDNVLVDVSGNACLCDFGMAGVIGDEPPPALSTTLFHGTIRWMAPERLSPRAFRITPALARTPESDRFSLGMTVYEVASDVFPFGSADELEVWDTIVRGGRPKHPGAKAFEKGMTDMLWHFVQLSWQADHTRRPTCGDLYLVLEGIHPTIMDRTVQGPRNVIQEQSMLAAPDFRDLVKNSRIPILEVENASERLPDEFGEGSICDLRRSQLASDGRVVVAKTVKGPTKALTFEVFEVLYKCILAQASLTHDNILPILGISPAWNKSQFSVLYEYMPDGNLEAYLEASTDVNDVSLLKDIASGLEYLHSKNIAHGEPTPVNVLITNTGKAVLRGFTYRIELHEAMNNVVSASLGRLRATAYLPPELLRGDNPPAKKSTAADVYTFSMTAYYVFFRVPPYDIGDINLHNRIIEGALPSLPGGGAAQVRGMSEAVREFLRRCWRSEGDRPVISSFFSVI